MTVTVYSKPRCVQCDATKRRLDRYQIPYNTVDVSEDGEALRYILGLGYQQVPVVVTPSQHFSGYRPDLLAGLVAERRAA